MNNCVSHTIIQGDTLQRLAAKYDMDSWESIVYLNNLQYPFIVDEIVPTSQRISNVKYIGDTILLPVTPLEEVNYISNDELQKRTYGIDVFLDFGIDNYGTQNFQSQGQLIESLGGDIEQAVGLENVRQSLILRLITEYGELPMHKDYGSEFMSMIGMRKTSSNLTKMRLEVMTTFKKDARVSDVKNCVVTAIQGGVSITCDIILVIPNVSMPFSASIFKGGETA